MALIPSNDSCAFRSLLVGQRAHQIYTRSKFQWPFRGTLLGVIEIKCNGRGIKGHNNDLNPYLGLLSISWDSAESNDAGCDEYFLIRQRPHFLQWPMEAVPPDGNGDWKLTWLEAITQMEILGGLPAARKCNYKSKTPPWLTCHAGLMAGMESKPFLYRGREVQMSDGTSQLHESKMCSLETISYFTLLFGWINVSLNSAKLKWKNWRISMWCLYQWPPGRQQRRVRRNWHQRWWTSSA